MGMSKKWRRYYTDPFGFFDNLDLRFKGFNLNIFARSRLVARNALYFSLVMLALWLILGFDSTPFQFIHALYEGVPGWIMGSLTFQDVVNVYNFYYGKEMHYSAFVIYGLMFWALSVHFDQGLLYWWRARRDPAAKRTGLGITKSKNIVYSTGLTLLAAGMFEWFWILSFAYWQNQPWVTAWKWPQLRIVLQNTIFVVVGALVALYMWTDSFIMDGRTVLGRRWRFNWNWKTWLLIGLTIGSALLWWFYPWPTQQIQVQLTNGQTWTSSPYFPQTLYTVDMNPADGINAGEWFYVQNDAVHGLNTLVKIFWTLAILYVGMIRKVKNHAA